MRVFSDLANAQRAIEEKLLWLLRLASGLCRRANRRNHANSGACSLLYRLRKDARDMELGGDIFTIETSYNEVHILWNNWELTISGFSVKSL